MKKTLLINGPNINMLGKREESLYGNISYEELTKELNKTASQCSINLEIFQSNHEGELVDKIQSAVNGVDAIIINAGAFTHTSIAIRDALLAVKIPFIEVHISNIQAREDFRKSSYLSDIASGVIFGFGLSSYTLALKGVAEIISDGDINDRR